MVTPIFGRRRAAELVDLGIRGFFNRLLGNEDLAEIGIVFLARIKYEVGMKFRVSDRFKHEIRSPATLLLNARDGYVA